MNRKIKINKIYHSNSYGDFIVIDKLEKDRYTIKFINTGSISTASDEAIYHGRVKDKFAPIIAGVGFIGNFNKKITDKNIIIFYRPWNDMMNRCYNPLDKDYKLYGGIGISVDKRWHEFANFFEDAKLLPGYENKLTNPSMYCLDKDYLQYNIPKHKRIYSRNTCIWISKYDNTIIMNRENSSSKFYGVTIVGDKYIARYSNNIIGVFSNAIAAANAYNYYYTKNIIGTQFHDIHIINDVIYMPPYEFIKYNLKSKEMCKIIK